MIAWPRKGGGTGIFMNSAQGGMVTADNRQPDGKDARTWEECLRIGHSAGRRSPADHQRRPGAALAQALLRRAALDAARWIPRCFACC